MGIDGPKERATFSLSPGIKSRLDETVPKSERSRYVENAIDEALRKDARASLANFLDQLPKSVEGENSTDLLRRMRLQWDGRPLDIIEGPAD